VLYQADLQHLVYDTGAVESRLSRGMMFTLARFPLSFHRCAAEGVNDVILIQYLALGGELTMTRGGPFSMPPDWLRRWSSFTLRDGSG